MVSAKDIKFMRNIVTAKGNYLSNRGDNARPVQPLNDRLVSYIPATPAPPITVSTQKPTLKPTAAKEPLNVGIILGAVALGISVIACGVVVSLHIRSKGGAPVAAQP